MEIDTCENCYRKNYTSYSVPPSNFCLHRWIYENQSKKECHRMSRLEPFALRKGLLESNVAREFGTPEIGASLNERVKHSLTKKYRDSTPRNSVEELFQDDSFPCYPLLLNSSGLYHHLTYGLISSIREKVSYIHVDHHSDKRSGYNPPSGHLSSATFVRDIMEREDVEGMILLGVGEEDCQGVDEQDLKSDRWFLDDTRKEVYLSIDLDILSENHLSTPFSQGELELETLTELISDIVDRKKVVGADIVGLERPYQGKDIKSYRKCLQALKDATGGEAV